MTTRTLYLVRHGQSEGNLHGIIQGHSNAPLTELGLEQARATAEWFKGSQAEQNIEAVYSSDLQRAYVTGQNIANALEVNITQREDIREAYFGKWEGMSAKDISEQDPEEFKKWIETKTWRPEWCESFESLQIRALNAVESCLSESTGNIIIASHGGFIYSLVNQWDASQLQPIQNCSITEVEIEYEDSIISTTVKHVSYLPENIPASPDPRKHYTDLVFKGNQ